MKPARQDLSALGVPAIPPPQRVVSLVPSITESLFDLDLGDRVVGITDYCIHPAGRLTLLPRLGGIRNPDIARIIALQPDLVLLNREANREEDARQLIEAGIPIWASHPQTVMEAINLLWDIMNVFAEPSATERVRWIERQMDWTAAATAQRRPVRVFVPIWYAPWLSASPQTYLHDLLRVCGGQNIFGEENPESAAPYPQVTLEQVVAAQPEVILLPDEPFALHERPVADLSALDIPATKSHRIHLVEGTLLAWPGTRVARAFAEIAPLLSYETSPWEP
jgi:iron complex transport system substrate-binding protein